MEYSNEQKYDACMLAADQIEKHPDGYSFASVKIPWGRDCGSPGCALGWIGCFLGLTSRMGLFDDRANDTHCIMRTEEVIGIGSIDFYRWMDRQPAIPRWRWNPQQCAAGLRLFAKQFETAQPVESSVTDWLEQHDCLEPVSEVAA